MAFTGPEKCKVYPSGAARMTVSTAMFPLAPVRFSTTNDCPIRSDSHWHASRASRSAVPPGAVATINLTGRFGYACAQAVRTIAGQARLPATSFTNDLRGKLLIRAPVDGWAAD